MKTNKFLNVALNVVCLLIYYAIQLILIFMLGCVLDYFIER